MSKITWNFKSQTDPDPWANTVTGIIQIYLIWGKKKLICSSTVVLRAELMPCCQGKCQEMFAWGECRVPVAKQGELFSPPLWHIKPNWHTAGLRTAFQTCQICQHRGGFIKKNNINIPGDQIRLPANDLSHCCSFMIETCTQGWVLFFFHDVVSLRIVAQMTK